MSDNDQNFAISTLPEIESLETLDLPTADKLAIRTKLTSRQNGLISFLKTTDSPRGERYSIMESFITTLEEERKKIGDVLAEMDSPSDEASKIAKTILMAIARQVEWANKEKPKHEPFPEIDLEGTNNQITHESSGMIGGVIYPPVKAPSPAPQQEPPVVAPTSATPSAAVAAMNRQHELLTNRSQHFALGLMARKDPSLLDKHYDLAFTKPIAKLEAALHQRVKQGDVGDQTRNMVRAWNKLKTLSEIARESINAAKLEEATKANQGNIIEVVVINNPLKALGHMFMNAINRVLGRSPSEDFRRAANSSSKIRTPQSALPDAPQTIQPV